MLWLSSRVVASWRRWLSKLKPKAYIGINCTKRIGVWGRAKGKRFQPWKTVSSKTWKPVRPWHRQPTGVQWGSVLNWEGYGLWVRRQGHDQIITVLCPSIHQTWRENTVLSFSYYLGAVYIGHWFSKVENVSFFHHSFTSHFVFTNYVVYALGHSSQTLAGIIII